MTRPPDEVKRDRRSGRARGGSVEVQRLHLAGEGVAAPAEQFGGLLSVAVGLAHRDADQGLFELG